MTQDYLNILEKAGIKSLSELSSQDPADLMQRLRQVSESAEDVPNIGMISYWIRNAKQTDLNVSARI